MDVELPDGTVIKDVPEGTTKQQLAEKLQAKGMNVPKEWITPQQPQPAQPPKEKGLIDEMSDVLARYKNITGGLTPVEQATSIVAEPIAKMLTGAAAKPVSEIAGMAATGYEAATGNKESADLPEQFMRDVQQQLTYEPRTEAGKSEYNPLNAVPAAINWAISGASNLAAKFAPQIAQLPGDENDPRSPRGVAANFIREAIPQALSIAGARKFPTTKEVESTQAALDTQKKLNAPKDEIRNKVQSAGFITPAEEGIKSQISTMSPARTSEALSVKNAETATRGVAEKVVGLPKDEPLTPVNINKRKMEAYKAYNDLENAVPELKMTDKVRTDIQNEITNLEGNVKSNPVFYSSLKPAISALKYEFKKSSVNPKQAMANISKYRQEAKSTFNKSSPSPDEVTVAHAKLFMADKLEDMFEQNIKDPNLLERYRAERKKLAELRVVEDATSADGTIDIQRIASIDQKRPGMLTGYLKDIADMGQVYPKASRTVKTAYSPFSYFDTIMAGGSIAAGHPGGLSLVAGKGIVPTLARKGMLQTKTPSYQAKYPVGKAAAATTAITEPSTADRKRAERKKKRGNE